jgi:Putative beta-barrel porin-2, OmpL-like. bbp2
MRISVRLSSIAIIAFGLAAAAGRASAQKPDQPVTLDNPGGDVQPVTGENEHALAISGFGVGGYTLDGKTKDNSFSAGKVAVSLFRELTDNLYVFGQLTTSISDEGGGEPTTETEIDNLLVSFTPKTASNLNLTLGTLDAPVGFERDDEVLLLTPSTSFNFELGRPAKLTGLFGTYTFNRRVDLTALVANGWDSPLDPNHGKTVGARLGVLPAERASLGFSALYGTEGEADETNDRLLLDADYAFEPGHGWIVAGEANYAKDYDLPDGSDARWSGAMLLVHRRVARHWGVAARAEVLDDKDGARTGQAQTLTSYTIAPIYSIGVGREGIFANIQHTTYRIPRFQIRGEVRLNHSNVPFFETSDGGVSKWGVQYTVQLVSTF